MRGYDEDGWRDYDGACDEFRDLVYSFYSKEYRAILQGLRNDESGEAWGPALVAIGELAEKIVEFSDTPFATYEAADLLETMVEGDF